MIGRTVTAVITGTFLAASALTSVAVAEDSFFTVLADPREVDDDVMGAASPELNLQPFWSQTEQLINQYGRCKNLVDWGPAAVETVNFTDFYASNAVRGFEATRDWMKTEGLFPLSTLKVQPEDPRAPRGIPVFCSTAPSSEAASEGRLRPYFIEYSNNKVFTHAHFKAIADVDFPGAARGERYNFAQRIHFASALAFAQLWEFDGRVGARQGDKAPDWIGHASFDAFAVAALEKANLLDFKNYDDLEQRLPFLQGNFSRRLTDFQRTQGGPPWAIQYEDETKGAFVKFLIEEVFGEDWSHLRQILDVTTDVDDPVHALHAYIDAHDGELMKGLQHAFPIFIAHQASLGWSKYKGRVNPTRWLGDMFDACEQVTLSEVSVSQKRVFDINPYASSCAVIRTEAKHAGWIGDLNMRVQLDGGKPGDTRAKAVFLSYSAMGENNLVKAEADCFSYAEQGGHARDCIAKPSGEGMNDEGVFQRLYHASELDRDPGQSQWHIYHFSYVPNDGPMKGAENRPSIKVEVAFALDAVIDGAGDLADMGKSSSGEFQLMDMSTASLDHGSKVGRGPILSRFTGSMDISWQSIFEGTATPIDGAILEGGMAGMDMLLNFVDEAGDGFGFVITDPTVLEPGFTGPTKAFIPVAGKDGYMSIPDPDYDGQIEIIENTEDTLYFTADEGFCMVSMDEWPRLLREENPDLCEFGERVTAKGKGAISFPTLRRTKTKLDPIETEEYKGLRALRMAQIQQRFGFGSISQGPRSGDGPPGDPPDGSSPRPVVDAGGTPLPSSCSILTTTGTCDCSCAAKACLQNKTTNATLAPRESACRLTCGKRWRECAN